MAGRDFPEEPPNDAQCRCLGKNEVNAKNSAVVAAILPSNSLVLVWTINAALSSQSFSLLGVYSRYSISFSIPCLADAQNTGNCPFLKTSQLMPSS
jgi:hypothetical protein